MCSVEQMKPMAKKENPTPEEPRTVDPERNSEGKLNCFGGSQSDDWNNILANQAVQTLWLKNSDEETKDR